MIWALGIYFLIQLTICLVASRWVRSETDFLLAGRSLGIVLASASLFATWFGAEVVMGSSGAIAQHGLSGGRADPFGYTACLMLMALFVAAPLRRKAYVTIGDFFADHYGRLNEVLGSVIMLTTSIIWAAAQVQAFALILSSVSHIGLSDALWISVLVVVAYTWFGGLMGDVITDLMQGGMIIVGLLGLLFVLVMKSGGFVSAMATIEPHRWSLIGPEGNWLLQTNTWAIPILGSMVAPEAMSRLLATKTEAVAVKACWVSAAFYLATGTVVALIALIGTPYLVPGANPDTFLPHMAQTILPAPLALLLLGALVSAILSTIDSTLLTVAGLVSHNMILPMIKRNVSEKTKVLLARGVVALCGVVVYVIATGGQGIYKLVEMASAFGSSGFLICVLGGLYWPKIGKWGALCVLITGVLGTLIYDYTLKLPGAFLLDLLTCSLVYAAFKMLPGHGSYLPGRG